MDVHEVLERIQKTKIKKPQTEGERLRAYRGVDVPMPKKKRASQAEENHHIAESKEFPVASERALFKPGSIFDLRFPHILQAAAPT